MRLKIKGMKDGKCKMKVEKALTNLDAVNKAVVNLQGGIADIEVSKEIPEDMLKKAVHDAGYDLVKIEED
ncbi:MAG: heavy-metal-associated domain-containing protein [Kosmotoga sp.]|nr:MAG: heavy-metal-associated domain-containing protein [Kosmotoga sp.]